MNGFIDSTLRALIDVSLSVEPSGRYQSVTAWIDTAFNSHLVMPRADIEMLGLTLVAGTEATLANRETVLLEAYLAYVDWFGKRLPVQVIANEGKMPLLGTELLKDRKLTIDYRCGRVTLEEGKALPPGASF